nr:hypothetical protein [Delftia acidovorans]
MERVESDSVVVGRLVVPVCAWATPAATSMHAEATAKVNFENLFMENSFA